jgi:hypothetical protein
VTEIRENHADFYVERAAASAPTRRRAAKLLKTVI